MPTLASDSKGTAQVLEAYEKANKSNKFAIDQARKHNRGLQKIYNKQKPKEKEKSSVPLLGSLFKF